jgi:hypothetical protein
VLLASCCQNSLLGVSQPRLEDANIDHMICAKKRISMFLFSLSVFFPIAPFILRSFLMFFLSLLRFLYLFFNLCSCLASFIPNNFLCGVEAVPQYTADESVRTPFRPTLCVDGALSAGGCKIAPRPNHPNLELWRLGSEDFGHF